MKSKRNQKIFIGIPILNRLDLLKVCIDSIDYNSDIVIINNNSIDTEFGAQLDLFCKSRHLSVYHQPFNLGVSASWNMIMRIGFARGYDWVFIGSNDTFLHPGSLQAAAEYTGDINVGVLNLSEFNFFSLSKESVRKVGWFDENFYPAYEEDQDYKYRCKLAEVSIVAVHGAGATHVISATIKSNPRYMQNNEATHFKWNKVYYVNKWGGSYMLETFVHPFNDPSRHYSWWPDPGDTIACRDWDKDLRGVIVNVHETQLSKPHYSSANSLYLNDDLMALRLTVAFRHVTSTVFEYNREGFDQRPMTFLENGLVGQGSATCESLWKLLTNSDGEIILEISSYWQTTCRLRQTGEKLWEGKWLSHEEMPIKLKPICKRNRGIQQ